MTIHSGLMFFVDFCIPALLVPLAAWLIYLGVRSILKKPTRHCPKCGYDMRGTDGLACPECGHIATSEQQLFTRKIRWIVMTVGVLLLIVPATVVILATTAFIQARSLNKLEARVANMGKGHRYQSDPRTPPHPPFWAQVLAHRIAGPILYFYPPSSQNQFANPQPTAPAVSLRTHAALWFLRFTQPLEIYHSYWPSKVVTGVWLKDPTPDQVLLTARCPDLINFDLTTSVGYQLKPEDFDGFENMQNLRYVIVRGSNIKPGVLTRIFKNKPQLSEVFISLDKQNGKGDAALVEIGAGSPILYDLRIESGGGVTDVGLAALAGCPNIREMLLRDVVAKADGLKSLAAMKHLSKLEITFSDKNDWTPANMNHIGQATWLEDLNLFTSLGTMKTPGTYNGIANLTNLRRLSLDMGELSDDDLAFLKPLDKLTYLNIRVRNATGKGFDAIRGHKLQELVISSGRKFRDEEMTFLQTLNDLTRLEISWNLGLSGDFMKHIPTTGRLHTLEMVNVDIRRIPNIDHVPLRRLIATGDVRVSDQAIANLVNHPTLARVTLKSSRLTDGCCQYLAKMPALEELDISDITPAGVRELMTSRSLKRLRVTSKSVTREDRKELAKLNPNIRLQ